MRFISATQSIDTDKRDPMAKFVLGLFGLLAEFERGMIVERTRAGVAEAQRQGKHCGRPRRVFRRDEVVRLRAEGLAWRVISERLGVPMMTAVNAWQELRKGLRRKPWATIKTKHLPDGMDRYGNRSVFVSEIPHVARPVAVLWHHDAAYRSH